MNVGLVLAVAVLSGVLTGLLGSMSSCDGAALALSAASFVLVTDSRHLRVGMLVGALFFFALADGALARERVMTAPLPAWFRSATAGGQDAGPREIRGVLASDASATAEGVRLIIDVESVADPSGPRRLRGRLQTHVSGTLGLSRVAEWRRGRRIGAPVFLREPQVWHNPGSPSEWWERLRRPVDLVATIKSAALVQIAPGPWPEEAAAALRQRVRDVSKRHLAPKSAQAAAVVVAILIGDRAGLADDVQRRLQAAGTYHVIAISGGNIAILTALLVTLLRTVVRSSRLVASVALAVIVAYGWIVGGEPSVRRAVTAAAVYLTLHLVGVVPRSLNVLALVAAILALTEPRAVLDAGAWLSFGATLGIVLGARRLSDWATDGAAPRDQTGEASPAVFTMARRCWLAGLELFTATVAAELALLPISSMLFSRVSWLGLILNFVAIPAMTVVQIAGMSMVAFAGWWESAANASAWVASVAARGLLDSSQAVMVAPWLVWRVPPTSIVWTVAFYAAIAAALRLPARSPRRRLAIAIACGSAIVIVSAPGLERAGPRAGRLRLTLLDVGQGDAILVQFPDAHSLLIDAGGLPAGSFDIGDRVVTPALWALGVRRLDWLAITHGDADHIGGAAGVERNFHPREIWEGIPVPPNPALQALRIQAHADGLAWRQVLAGQALELGGATLDVVHPASPSWERRRVRNDDSVVLRVRFGSVEFLLTGDAGTEFEDAFASRLPRAPLRVLKVPHHGSRSSSSARFVKLFAPEVALISVGRDNPFGHPAPDVLARYMELGAVVFRTDQDGAAILETDGATLDVTTKSGRRWRMSAR